jgi:hypothetical protein
MINFYREYYISFPSFLNYKSICSSNISNHTHWDVKIGLIWGYFHICLLVYGEYVITNRVDRNNIENRNKAKHEVGKYVQRNIIDFRVAIRTSVHVNIFPRRLKAIVVNIIQYSAKINEVIFSIPNGIWNTQTGTL